MLLFQLVLLLADPNVVYKVTTTVPPYGTLRATENGKTYVVIGRAKQTCMEVADQKDFDGNGSTDALILVRPACGGSCCPNAFFFVSADGGGKFTISESFGESWSTPVVEKWKDLWSVLVSQTNDGITTEQRTEIRKRFVLKAGKAVQVDESARASMLALVELKSLDFDTQKRGETQSIEYDLDGDGRMDTISGKLSDRMNRWDWGTLNWTVSFANGKTFKSEGCRRVGVLASTTHGVHDLVCDQDTVLRWDGVGYK